MTFMAVEVLTRGGHTESALRLAGRLAGERGKGFAKTEVEPDSKWARIDARELRRMIVANAVVVGPVIK
jgi:3,4-dihydroxy-2-butanone 4-phosphate synthase